MKTNQLIMSAAWLLLTVSPVAASSGTVTGKLQFYQNQGNYCPTTRNCTGAKYPQSQFHTNRPVQNTLVYVYRQSTNGLVGAGATDSNGNFSIAWSDPSATGSISVRIQWYGFHKDGRFYLTNSTGQSIPSLVSSSKTLSNGTTTNVSTITFGSSSSPNAFANLYDGAHMEWANGLSQSNRMVSYFTNVLVRAWDLSCPNSCAYPDQNLVIIDLPESAYTPQRRVMHEMGHVASYKASFGNSFTWGGDGNFNNDSGWRPTSPEWGAVQFEEGLACYFSDLGLYFANAVAPHDCLNTVACTTTTDNNIETSQGTSCAVDDNRKPLNAERYLWDIYDTVVDSNYADNTGSGAGFVFDMMQFMLPGTGEHQKDEPWDPTYTFLDDKDGRSTADFRYAGFLVGAETATQLANNCGSPGD